ncbi:MAG TPA: hypothetical protein PKD85_04515 [Saprospiraceae bacterium]|nr:hypothetical protein [Saprospiraceae bacterium]
MRKISIFVFILSISNFVFGQKTLRTELGNIVVIKIDGSIEFTQQYIYPFENPNFNYLVDETYKAKLEKINQSFRELDLNLCNKRIFLDKELFNKQSARQVANISKNEIDKIDPEILELKKMIKSNEKSYSLLKKEFDRFNKVYTLKNEQDIANIIDQNYNRITKKFDIKSQVQEPSEGKANNKSNLLKKNKKFDETEISADTRHAWEISNTFSDNLFVLYTPVTLKSYHKDDQFLKGYANLVKNNKEYFLSIKFVFASNDVIKSYGYIRAGDFMKINFIYGQSMFLLAEEDAIGNIEKNTGNTVYNVDFKLTSKNDIKRINSGLIDSIGILWTSGFETYPVYKIDLLSNQYKTLNGH